MFTTKKPLLLLFFLGTINLSICEQERDADEEERRDDPYETDAEVEKRFIPLVSGLFSKLLGK
nr:temporin-FL [Pelophylax nigromaculatus]